MCSVKPRGTLTHVLYVSDLGTEVHELRADGRLKDRDARVKPNRPVSRPPAAHREPIQIPSRPLPAPMASQGQSRVVGPFVLPDLPTDGEISLEDFRVFGRGFDDEKFALPLMSFDEGPPLNLFDRWNMRWDDVPDLVSFI